MNYSKEVHTFKSSNGHNLVTYFIYKPLTSPRAILQISHGMCEYVERYEHFIDFMTIQGILVCGNDHIGHKNSVANKEDLGYFASRNGWTYLTKDLATLTRSIKKEYPNLPIFLFGHSMGSFIARAYLVEYPDLLNGAIICGTAGTNPILGLGKFFISMVKTLKGDRYRSKFLDNLMFGSYNKKYATVRTAKDWLSTDETIVDTYLKDEYCMFIFTTSAFHDLSMLLGSVSSNEWYRFVPKNLPIYLISGSMDPVGNYSKGILEVAERLNAQQLSDFSYKLYPNYRHELLNEIGKEEVYQDVLNFVNTHIS
ncbi:MAG: alpha/beta fold hydrolase [Velocimicrobium sp.]